MEVPSFHSTNQEPQKNRGKNSQQSGILLPLSASLSAASRFSGRYFFFRGKEGEGEPEEEREGAKSRGEKGGLTEEAGSGGKGGLGGFFVLVPLDVL